MQPYAGSISHPGSYHCAMANPNTYNMFSGYYKLGVYYVAKTNKQK